VRQLGRPLAGVVGVAVIVMAPWAYEVVAAKLSAVEDVGCIFEDVLIAIGRAQASESWSAPSEERAKETALAEAAHQTQQDRAGLVVREMELVWATSGRPNMRQRCPDRGLFQDVVYRCLVEDPSGNVHAVDIDVRTGVVTSFIDGTVVYTLGPDDLRR
jgi:D-alanyl-D-alanine dipeptidase